MIQSMINNLLESEVNNNNNNNNNNLLLYNTVIIGVLTVQLMC